MNSTELLSCPFCGGAAYPASETDDDDIRWHFIRCRGCGVRTRGKWHSPGNDCPQLRAEVRDEWQRRTSINSVVCEAGGWKLVPVEPTEEMLEAGKDERMECLKLPQSPPISVGLALTRIHKAMLSASPPPPGSARDSAEANAYLDNEKAEKMLLKEHSADWVRAIEHAVSRIEATVIVPGQTPEQLREAIRQRVKDIAAPTYVVTDSAEADKTKEGGVADEFGGLLQEIDAAGMSAEGGEAKSETSLSEINELAKTYASSYASPHHITFTVEGLRNLIAASPKAGESRIEQRQ